MPLMTRLSRLMRADFNAVLDRLEEPDILLAQALREMQEAVAADTRALAALRGDRQRLQERRATLARRQTTISAELDLCLDTGQEDLARALLRRQLEQQRLDAGLERHERDLDTRIETLDAVLDRRRQRLASLRAESTLVIDISALDDTERCDQDADLSAPIRDTDVEVALLAAKRRRAS